MPELTEIIEAIKSETMTLKADLKANTDTQIVAIDEKIKGLEDKIKAFDKKDGQIEELTKSLESLKSDINELAKKKPAPNIVLKERELTQEDITGAAIKALVDVSHAKNVDSPSAKMTMDFMQNSDDYAMKAAFKQTEELTESLKAYSSVGDLSSAGILIPETVASGIVEALRDSNGIDKLGARKIKLPHANYTWNVQDTVTTAQYIGENPDTSTETRPAFNQESIQLKKINAISEVSNDLLRFAPGYSRIITQDLLKAVATKRDEGLLTGSGASNIPKGLTAYLPSSTTVAALASTAAGVMTALTKVLSIMSTLGHDDNAKKALIMHPAAKYFLSNEVYSGTAIKYFPDLLGPNAKMANMPVITTQHIPTAASTDETNIYVVLVDDITVFAGPAMRIEFVRNGTYTNSAAATRAGLTHDTSVFNVIDYNEIVPKYETSIGAVTNIDVTGYIPA